MLWCLANWIIFLLVVIKCRLLFSRSPLIGFNTLVVDRERKDGWYFDETLFEVSSARCPTFDNEPLCSPGANKAGAVGFKCVGLEVWGVGL